MVSSDITTLSAGLCPQLGSYLDHALGVIQVLRNVDGGGGGVSDFLEKSVTKV